MNKFLMMIVIFLIGLSVVEGMFLENEKSTVLLAPLPKELDLKPKGNVTVIVSVLFGSISLLVNIMVPPLSGARSPATFRYTKM